MIYFFNATQRTDLAPGCCSRSLVPIDRDGRAAVGRGHPQVGTLAVWGGHLSPNLVVLTLVFVEKRGMCRAVFCSALPERVRMES